MMQTGQQWVSVWGHVEFANGVLTHDPSRAVFEQLQPTDVNRVEQPRYAAHSVARSNVEFGQGTISWEMQIEEDTARCLILLPSEPTASDRGELAAGAVSVGEFIAIGVNCLGAPYGVAHLVGWGQWNPVVGVGHGTRPATKSWTKFSVTATGSEIDLSVGEVKILSFSRALRRGQIAAFMQSDMRVFLRDVQTTSKRPLCFVVMQFTSEFDTLYREVIRPICENFGYQVIRGDDFASSGQILEDVIRSIRTAELVIADVTPDNANVFYELGYAHAVGKQTILLSDRKRQRLPFDISGFRTLFYDDSIGGKSRVEDQLRQHLQALRPR